MALGVLLGRFQPFHIGHESMVHEIMSDGLEPLIVIGSPNKNDLKNPLTIHERYVMIRNVFPDVLVRTCDDSDNWDKWWDECMPPIAKTQGNVFYINEKDSDRQSFVFRGEVYTNTFYTDIYQELGIPVKRVEFPRKLGIYINASDIRNDMEGNRHYLDGRNYEQLKRWKAFNA